MLIESVRTLARDRIAPNAARYDRSGEFPWENVEAINALGLNAMFIPEAYGGAPLSYAAYLECVRELSKACASTGVIWATNFHAMKPLVDFGTEEQKARLLPVMVKGGVASPAVAARPRNDSASRDERDSVAQRIENYRGTGPLTDAQMIEVQAAIVRLDDSSRKQMMSRLMRAWQSGEIDGRL